LSRAAQFAPAIAGLFGFAPVAAAKMVAILLGSAAVLFILERMKPLWGNQLLESDGELTLIMAKPLQPASIPLNDAATASDPSPCQVPVK